MVRLPEPLTRRQKATLDAIRRFAADWGYMPSVAELARALDLAKSTVHFHIVSLTRKGYLSHDGTDHGLRLAAEPAVSTRVEPEALEVPVVGTIAAGLPLEAFEEHGESVAVPARLVRGETFALRVRGMSMIDDGIFDGDLVVVRSQPDVEDGEVAVALLEDGSATLKRVYRERDRIRLQPANPAMQPIYVSAIRVQGRVVGLLRFYR